MPWHNAKSNVLTVANKLAHMSSPLPFFQAAEILSCVTAVTSPSLIFYGLKTRLLAWGPLWALREAPLITDLTRVWLGADKGLHKSYLAIWQQVTMPWRHRGMALHGHTRPGNLPANHHTGKALHGHTCQSAKSPRHDGTGLIIIGSKPVDRHMIINVGRSPTGTDSGNNAIYLQTAPKSLHPVPLNHYALYQNSLPTFLNACYVYSLNRYIQLL